jgi:hypothetical protein
MKKYTVLAAIALTPLLLAGCATSSVFPMGNNTYKVVSLAQYENDAEQASLKKAAATCKGQHKSFTVLTSHSVYQGMNKGVAALVEVASQATQKNNDISQDPVDHSEDYKNTTYFRCQ